MQNLPLSNVVYFQQRPSKADSAFAPILSQREINTASADELCSALAAVARPRLLIAALIAAAFGLAWVAAWFVVCAVFAKPLLRRYYG